MEAEQRVARVAEHLQVAALVGVAVVVDPLGRHAVGCSASGCDRSSPCGDQPGWRAIDQPAARQSASTSPAPTPWVRSASSTPPGSRRGCRSSSRGGSRRAAWTSDWCDDLLEQLVGQLGHVRQLRPRPLQRRPELGHEVAHALLAAGDPVGHERPHERPPQARPEAHRVVDLRRGRDVVIHQPQRLAPHRLHQPVGDEAVDLACARAAATCPRDAYSSARASRSSPARCARAAHLDQRQQVHGVERMADARAARGVACRPEIREGSRPEVDEAITACSGAAAVGVAPAARASVGSRSGALSCTKSTSVTACLDASRRPSACPRRGSGRVRQPARGPAGVCEHLARPGDRLGVGVVQRDVVPGSRKRAAQPPPITPPPSRRPGHRAAGSVTPTSPACRAPRRGRARARSCPTGSPRPVRPARRWWRARRGESIRLSSSPTRTLPPGEHRHGRRTAAASARSRRPRRRRRRAAG